MSEMLIVSIVILVLMFFVISLANRLAENNAKMQKRHLYEVKSLYGTIFKELKGLNIQTNDVVRLQEIYMKKIVEIEEFEQLNNSH